MQTCFSIMDDQQFDKSETDAASARAEAAEWWSKVRGHDLSTQQQAAFELWLSSDTRHAVAFQEIHRLWNASASVPAVQHAMTRHTRRVFLRRISVLTGSGMLAATGALLIGAQHPFASYRTEVGQRRLVELEDGSTLELSTKTALDVRYDDQARRIHLLQGEVYCTVKASDARPFQVHCEACSATAVGTQFSVFANGSHARVAVTEHEVEVRSREQTIRLQSGQMLEIGHRIQSSIQALPPSLLAWRNGRLEFLSTPLEEVAQTIQRWHGGVIFVMGSELKALPVTLLIDLNRVWEDLQKLPQILPVEITNVSEWMTILHPSQS